MAGHSKWANIKHRKAGVDKKRGLMFSKLSKELMVSARLGGTDEATNNRLRIAITKARSANMPRDTIERAIKKGAGETGSLDYEEFLYEAYAPGGIGVIIEGLSDKMARTTPEIKSILTKSKASLAESNAVKRLFNYNGYVSIQKQAISEEELMELVIDAGADDIKEDDDQFEIFTSLEDFVNVSEVISAKDLQVIESGLKYFPIEGTEIPVKNAQKAQKILNFIDKLEEHDDVQAVYTNMDISDQILLEMQ